MKHHLAAALAALLFVAGLATTVRADERPEPQKIVFLDMNKAFDTYRKFQEAMAKLETKHAELIRELKARAAKLEQDAGKLSTLNPGTPDYANLKRELNTAKYVLDFDHEQVNKDFETGQRKLQALIYKEVCDEAAAYAQEKGYAAVLNYTPPSVDRLPQSSVLWRDERLDVTADVVARLNAQLPPPSTVKVPPPANGPEPAKSEKPKDEPAKPDDPAQPK